MNFADLFVFSEWLTAFMVTCVFSVLHHTKKRTCISETKGDKVLTDGHNNNLLNYTGDSHSSTTTTTQWHLVEKILATPTSLLCLTLLYRETDQNSVLKAKTDICGCKLVEFCAKIFTFDYFYSLTLSR